MIQNYRNTFRLSIVISSLLTKHTVYRCNKNPGSSIRQMKKKNVKYIIYEMW